MEDSSSSLRPQVELQLLGGFAVRQRGKAVELPAGAQRLVAFLAVQERPVPRDYAAGMLWLDSPDDRAAANLRSTLWRIQQRVGGLVEARVSVVSLGPAVAVDLRAAEASARRELASGGESSDARLYATDLLPGWYEDWLILERERFRQLRLAALESLGERHLRAGRLDLALEVGLLSLAAEPLRESSHRALIRVHLAAGNVAEALRQLVLCRRLLREQLGVEPSAHLVRLIDELDSAGGRDAAVTLG